MVKRFSTAAILALMICWVSDCSSLAAQQSGPADLVLHNGKILTVDSNFATAQAVAITGNKISAVGQNQDVMKLAGPKTTVIDLKGRTVVPGLIDTHRHIYTTNYDGKLTPEQLRRFPLDWRGVKTKDDLLVQIRGTMDKYKFKPGEWVYFVSNGLSAMGAGGSSSGSQLQLLFDGLSRQDLDTVTPNNPVTLSEGIPDQNGLFVNSKGLDEIMAKQGDFIKKYGRLWIDSSGRPDGHLEPPATRIVLAAVPEPEPSVAGPEYKKMIDELDAMGLTTVSTQLTDDRIAAYQWLESQGQMTIRMAYGKATDFGTALITKSQLTQLAKLQGTGTDKVWMISAAPSNVDGSGSRSCMGMQRQTTYGAIDGWWPMGQCHMDSEYHGAKGAPTSGNYYRDWVLQSSASGLRFANTHVAGERTVSLLLGLAEQAQKQSGPQATKGMAFDHCTFVNPRDFKQAARLGITFSCAPKYIADNAAAAEKAYGDTVANTFVVPVKSMLDAGIKVVFEADDANYLWGGFEMLQTRKDRNGKVWGPQERVDRTTVLKMATRWAADYVLKGDQLGSIEPGKMADLVVLDQDYMTIPAEQFHAIEPQLTVFDGKIVFVHPQFSQEYNLKPAGAVISTYKDLVARRAAGGAVAD
jgi:predicted amidohydrolase YtcJ